MERKQSLWAVAWSIWLLQASVACAGAPMGPPMATLDEGQWAISAEYGHTEIDLEAFGTIAQVLGGPQPATAEILSIENLKTDMVFGNVAYGICDNWDLFLRAGTADAQGDATIGASSAGVAGERFGMDGSYGFAWGLGTRATFCRSGPWSFGGLLQVTWLDPADSDIRSIDPSVPTIVSVGTADIDFWQTQVALAAVYQIDAWHLWVGPFLQFVEGDLERRGDILVNGTDSGDFTAKADIEESTQVGVHCGLNWAISREWNLWTEGQWTSDSWLVGLGVAIAPERAFSEP